MVAVLWLVRSAIFLCTLKFRWRHLASRGSALLRALGLTVLRCGGDPLVANPADSLRCTRHYPRVLSRWRFFENKDADQSSVEAAAFELLAMGRKG
jgi:hypothetical protein